MGFQPSMTWHTEGIHPVAPAQWRQLDGLMSVCWDAEGATGAHAYYRSPNPRIVIFFNDVSASIRMSNRQGGIGKDDRPLTRAIYVPAGMPMWTQFIASHRFSHLDLHLHEDRLLRFLAPSVGSSVARTILRRPVEIQDIGPIEPLARMIADEVVHPSRHPVYAESLVGAVAAALLDIPADSGEKGADGRITKAQMKRLLSAIEGKSDFRMSVADMADTVGLSESWFSTAFRQTTGKTPLQWQLSKRIERAQNLLVSTSLSVADVAAQLGFSDQAHLTKVFRQVTGETPAAWRRAQLLQYR
ncbi:helix-turn-helix domain-containing protein [Martelella mediterranea]|uniref:AraC family transcriptional regulator n=1 Tax=Martelella mediterranea TaxID=293089 RepID=A0A4R3NMI2_9HYPH|nr:AraC family transcriptional regulator [Martelella mediterranea]TCT32661.1 AraC family transcriptional regulator [Martelella mediterranea]